MATTTPIRQTTTIQILFLSSSSFFTIAWSAETQLCENLHLTLSCSLSLTSSCFSLTQVSFSASRISFYSITSFFSAYSTIMSTKFLSAFSMHLLTMSHSVRITSWALCVHSSFIHWTNPHLSDLSWTTKPQTNIHFHYLQPNIWLKLEEQSLKHNHLPSGGIQGTNGHNVGLHRHTGNEDAYHDSTEPRIDPQHHPNVNPQYRQEEN